MDWHSETRGSARVVAPSGEIDYPTAEDFEARLMPEVDAAADGGGVLVIDLKNVVHMSSVGLRVLDRALKYAEESTVKIRMAQPNPAMVDIIKITRFDKLVPVFDTVDGAVTG